MAIPVSIQVPGKEFEPNWCLDLPVEHYHADKTAVSSSHLRKILKSPRTFYSSFVEEKSDAPTEAMKFGTLAHLAILEGEKFRQRYVVIPDFGDMRSSKNRANKQAWANEQNPESILCKQEECEHLFGMIEAIVEHQDAYALLKDGATEASGYYADPETGIKCRIRPDFVSFNMGSLVDVKTTIDCNVECFARSIWDKRYDFQIAMYCEGASLISKKKIEYGSFIAIEKKPPYEVAVYVADEAMMEIGTMDYHRALRRLRKHLDEGAWARYQQSLQNIALPHWVLQQYQIGE